IRTSLGGAADIRVEEYKRPTFEVSLSPSREPARLNHLLALSGEAKYYFGLPVQGGQVKWKVEREQRYPWWWCFWRPPSRPAQVVASGAGTVDAKGQFAVAFTPEADPEAQAGCQFNYRVSADLTDEGGETRSANGSFVVGQASIQARLDLPSGFFLEGRG